MERISYGPGFLSATDAVFRDAPLERLVMNSSTTLTP